MSSFINTDTISTCLGAPPHHWKKNECEQIRQIQKAYRDSYTASVRNAPINKKSEEELNLNDLQMQLQRDNPAAAVEEEAEDKDKGKSQIDGGASGDPEGFLPKDSPLRSKDGEKREPGNPVFKDFETFENSCSFDYWRSHFDQANNDEFLCETAQTIVANICVAQSRNQMRVHAGHIPFRKKREHITPLALVLHEFKLWATNDLRTASTVNEDTFLELRCRVRYLEALSQKEVWGDASTKLEAGMRYKDQSKLFKLFRSSREALERAEEYAYRGFNKRSSREKLAKAKDCLKDLLTDQIKMVSNRLTIEEKLEDPKTYRLQPPDLLNHISNQLFVDYKNMANVMLYKMCRNPMVKASMTGDYEKPEVMKIIEDIGNWSAGNYFCVPPADGKGEPIYKMDEKKELKILPAIYGQAASELKKQLREYDPEADIPNSPKTVVKILIATYGSVEDAALVMRCVMKNAAAAQDLVPTIYAMHQLWSLAGDGGDFTIYDTMRDAVIKMLTDTIQRVTILRKSAKVLNTEIGKLVKKRDAAMQKDAKGMKYKPAWMLNHHFINTELLSSDDKSFDTTLLKLIEIVNDAKAYQLTTDQLSDKVKDARKVFAAISGGPGVVASDTKSRVGGSKDEVMSVSPSEAGAAPKKDGKKKAKKGGARDWLRAEKKPELTKEDYKFPTSVGSRNAAEDEDDF